VRLLVLAAASLAVMAASGGRSAAPRLIESRMSDGKFVPAVLTAHPGDTLRFKNGLGGPHNVQFFADSIPAASQAILDAAMPEEKIGPLSSHLLLEEDEVYQFVVPALPPGRYPFVCLPHFAMSMKGALVVEAAP
jgi:plastocyanin